MPSTEKEPGAAPDRRALGIAAAVVAACGGLVLYGVLHTQDKPAKPAAPTAAVTYEVTGEGKADIAYESGGKRASVARSARLPWKKTVRVPLGHAPLVAITLGEKGGRADCSLAVEGRHVQAASAYGRFGRATCQGEPGSPEATGTAE